VSGHDTPSSRTPASDLSGQPSLADALFDNDLDDDRFDYLSGVVDLAGRAGWDGWDDRAAQRRGSSGRGGRPEPDEPTGGFEHSPERERLLVEESERIQPDEGDGGSTFPDATQGPQPWPDWLIADRAAVDVDIGVLKTGKEADVYLLDRYVPGTDRRVTLAVKRYRDIDHSQFTRDASYLAGRRVRKSRDQRAMDNKTRAGRAMLAGQWAGAEFGYLSQLWELGLPVPYPVQLLGSELMMEFVTDHDGQAAPRLAQLRPDPATAEGLWDQLVEAMLVMADNGWTHGDLSPFNLLVADDQLVLIDLPQVIDVVANPDGREFLLRDVRNVCDWFGQHGVVDADAERLGERLLKAAGMT
jgi:RIO kinase 1